MRSFRAWRDLPALVGWGGEVDLGEPDGQVEAVPQKARATLEWAVKPGVRIWMAHVGVMPMDTASERWERFRRARAIACYGEKIGGVLAIETGPSRLFCCAGYSTRWAAPESASTTIREPHSLSLQDWRNEVASPTEREAAMKTSSEPNEGPLVLGGRIVHTHAKDALVREDGQRQEVPLGEGWVDWPRYVANLRSIGYRGYFAIEREVGEDPVGDIRRAVEFLRTYLTGPRRIRRGPGPGSERQRRRGYGSMRMALLAVGILLLGSCAAQPAKVQEMRSSAATKAGPVEGDWFWFSAAFMDEKPEANPEVLACAKQGMFDAYAFWPPLTPEMTEFVKKGNYGFFYWLPPAVPVLEQARCSGERPGDGQRRIRGGGAGQAAGAGQVPGRQALVDGHARVRQQRTLAQAAAAAAMTREEAFRQWKAYYLGLQPLGQYMRMTPQQLGVLTMSDAGYSCHSHYAYELGAQLNLLERDNDDIGDLTTGIAFARRRPAVQPPLGHRHLGVALRHRQPHGLRRERQVAARLVNELLQASPVHLLHVRRERHPHGAGALSQ